MTRLLHWMNKFLYLIDKLYNSISIVVLLSYFIINQHITLIQIIYIGLKNKSFRFCGLTLVQLDKPKISV